MLTPIGHRGSVEALAGDNAAVGGPGAGGHLEVGEADEGDDVRRGVVGVGDAVGDGDVVHPPGDVHRGGEDVLHQAHQGGGLAQGRRLRWEEFGHRDPWGGMRAKGDLGWVGGLGSPQGNLVPRLQTLPMKCPKLALSQPKISLQKQQGQNQCPLDHGPTMTTMTMPTTMTTVTMMTM